MANDVTVLFVNLPQAPDLRQHIQHRLAALASASHAVAGYQVRIEARQRHHALGHLFYVDILRDAADGARKIKIAHAVHSELSTAVATALDSLALAGAGRAPSQPRRNGEAIDGHIVKLMPNEGAGVLATAGGEQISFTRADVENEEFEALRVGDRAWWIRADPCGCGRLLCMSRSHLRHLGTAPHGKTGWMHRSDCSARAGVD